MASLTNYENQVSEDAIKRMELLVEGVAPEFLLEMLSDTYARRPGPYNRIACAWLFAAASQVCEELPGHPAQKDFPEEGKTIGQQVAHLWAKHSPDKVSLKDDVALADLVDLVINRKVVANMLEKWEKWP